MGVWDHNYLWVLDVKDCGGVDKIVSVAQDTGYGICAKYHDGDPSDDGRYGFRANFLALAVACCRLDIPIVAWGYCYGNKYGSLAKEYRAAVRALKEGAQAYVIDAEVEWEVPESAAWADEFMSEVKAAVPNAEIGLTTFWNLRWHPRIPAKRFARAGAVPLPQTYYASARRTTRQSREEMHSMANEDFRRAGFSGIYPVGELPSESRKGAAAAGFAVTRKGLAEQRRSPGLSWRESLIGAPGTDGPDRLPGFSGSSRRKPRDSRGSIAPPGSAVARGQNDLIDFLDIAGATPHSLWLLDRHQDSESIQLLRQRRALTALWEHGILVAPSVGLFHKRKS